MGDWTGVGSASETVGVETAQIACEEACEVAPQTATCSSPHSVPKRILSCRECWVLGCRGAGRLTRTHMVKSVPVSRQLTFPFGFRSCQEPQTRA